MEYAAPVKYEYQFDETRNSKIDFDALIAEQFEIPTTGNHEYAHLIEFFAKGRHHLVLVQDSKNVIIYNDRTERIRIIEMQPGIRGITRYSAYIQVQYDHHIEYILFDQAQILETVSKVSLKERIINVSQDVAYTKFVFVQTENQIYLYDCDALLQ